MRASSTTTPCIVCEYDCASAPGAGAHSTYLGRAHLYLNQAPTAFLARISEITAERRRGVPFPGLTTKHTRQTFSRHQNWTRRGEFDVFDGGEGSKG